MQTSMNKTLNSFFLLICVFSAGTDIVLYYSEDECKKLQLVAGILYKFILSLLWCAQYILTSDSKSKSPLPGAESLLKEHKGILTIQTVRRQETNGTRCIQQADYTVCTEIASVTYL